MYDRIRPCDHWLIFCWLFAFSRLPSPMFLTSPSAITFTPCLTAKETTARLILCSRSWTFDSHLALRLTFALLNVCHLAECLLHLDILDWSSARHLFLCWTVLLSSRQLMIAALRVWHKRRDESPPSPRPSHHLLREQVFRGHPRPQDSIHTNKTDDCTPSALL